MFHQIGAHDSCLCKDILCLHLLLVGWQHPGSQHWPCLPPDQQSLIYVRIRVWTQLLSPQFEFLNCVEFRPAVFSLALVCLDFSKVSNMSFIACAGLDKLFSAVDFSFLAIYRLLNMGEVLHSIWTGQELSFAIKWTWEVCFCCNLYLYAILIHETLK